MQKLLTIVVPVYKVEQYINKCLDSCIIYKADGTLDEEKMNQLEVIIVNDGTPDRSAEMSREYTVRYPQTFRQIDQENRGHGGAWNHGLKEATGKYISFLDSDDWVTNLGALIDILKKSNADLIFCHRNQYQAVDGSITETMIAGNCVADTPIKDFPFYQQTTEAITSFQYCIFKKEILSCWNQLFDEHVFYDDVILYVAPWVHAKSFMICDIIYYNYFLGRPGQSVAPAIKKRNFGFMVKEFLYMYNLLTDHYNEMPAQIACWVTGGVFHYAYTEILPYVALTNYYYYSRFISAFKVLMMKDHWDNLPLTKQALRVLKYPVAILYLLEKFRIWKNKQ